jgi:aconitase A
MDGIALEIFTEIWLPHNGLLASKLGKKASTNLGAIQFKAAEAMAQRGDNAVLLAGERYGMGSSRDWAAKTGLRFWVSELLSHAVLSVSTVLI